MIFPKSLLYLILISANLVSESFICQNRPSRKGTCRSVVPNHNYLFWTFEISHLSNASKHMTFGSTFPTKTLLIYLEAGLVSPHDSILAKS